MLSVVVWGSWSEMIRWVFVGVSQMVFFSGCGSHQCCPRTGRCLPCLAACLMADLMAGLKAGFGVFLFEERAQEKLEVG